MVGWPSRFRRGKQEHDLERELRFHVDQSIRDKVASGLSPEEARRATVLEFGALEQVKEACRDERKSALIEQLIQDLHYGLRQLRRAPGFAATAVLTMALGIGVCAALFSIVNGVLLRPLQFTEPERIVS